MFHQHLVESIEKKKGWGEDIEGVTEYIKKILFIISFFLTLNSIILFIYDIILYFYYSENFRVMSLIFRFGLIISLWCLYFLFPELMKKFGDYHSKSFIEIEYSKFIIYIEKFLSENKISFKKLGKGWIFYIQKYEELFSLENGLKIYIINIPKTFMQKQQTNIMIGKITSSNKEFAELIKSELNKLEQ